MSKIRKSFVLHKDSLDILPDLTDEQAGKLFKAIHLYQIDEGLNLDQITKMVFLPFKNQFIRDNEKYTETCERRAIAGSKGGKQKVANASKCLQKVANVADSVSKSVSKNKSDSVSEVIDHLNKVINAKYKSSTKSHAENISARLNDGHSVNDLKLVIDSKSKEWASDKKMSQYLRPSTLFSVSKFQGYLMQAKPIMQSSAPKDFSQ